MVPITPTKHQKAFLDADNTELAFLGTPTRDCGVGKTTALLLALFKHADEPSFCGLFVSRTHLQLVSPSGPVKTARDWAGTNSVYSSSHLRLTFDSGATIQFANCDGSDYVKFMGLRFDCICVDNASLWKGRKISEDDEVGLLHPEFYDVLYTRLNTNGKMRIAASLDGIGVPWIKQRFMPNVVMD
jgi:hypothetical protein